MPAAAEDGPIRVRAMLPDDVDEICALPLDIGSGSWGKEALKSSLHQRDYCLTAVAPGQAVGFCVCRPAGPVIEVLQIAVNPGFRRMGIARTMIMCAMGWAYDQGLCEVWLEVREGNKPARFLYKELGFVETGIRKAYYTDALLQEDAVLMSRSLADGV